MNYNTKLYDMSQTSSKIFATITMHFILLETAAAARVKG